jgi:hypothetical protein
MRLAARSILIPIGPIHRDDCALDPVIGSVVRVGVVEELDRTAVLPGSFVADWLATANGVSMS